MILKLKSFIDMGIFIVQKTFLTLHVAFNFLDKTKYST